MKSSSFFLSDYTIFKSVRCDLQFLACLGGLYILPCQIVPLRTDIFLVILNAFSFNSESAFMNFTSKSIEESWEKLPEMNVWSPNDLNPHQILSYLWEKSLKIVCSRWKITSDPCRNHEIWSEKYGDIVLSCI